MNRLKKLLLACAIVPLSQIALQAAAQANDGNFLLAQAGPPACQPGDPNCAPPEKVAPPQKKQPEAQPEAPAPRPEAQPEPAAPKQEAQPERPAPEPQAQPEAPAPRSEAQPEPAAPKQEAKPERPAPEPKAQPEAPAPRPEAQPEPAAPKQEAKPERPAPEPKAQPEAPVPDQKAQPEPFPPKKKGKPERPAAQPEVQPETPAAQPEPTTPKQETKPERPAAQPEAGPGPVAPKPDSQPGGATPPAEPTAPRPDAKPAAPVPEPTAQPKPPIPAPAAPGGAVIQPSSPNSAAPAVAPGTPPPPVQPGDQPLPPDVAGKQAPPPALIQKLGNPGAAAAAAIDQSVEQKAGNIRDVQRERRVISNENGVQVTVEPGGRVIVQSGDEAVIRHDDRARFDRDGRDYRERQTREGGREVLVTTRDGDEVRTLYDPNGMIIQRERRDRDGRVYVLFDNRSFGPGPVDTPDWQPVVRLPPPVYDMPRERYRVEMRSAPPQYVEEALTAPPIVEVQPQYTLDQVIYSPDLRERVRSVDLDTITFPSGAWTVDSSQARSLDAVAQGIEAALQRNPNEVFLVEGYTDAVGSVVDNLSLSDRRAEAVANVLTDQYRIPPENLVTQGYGESNLKVQTEGPERANRRVTVRRITPLLATKSQQQ